MRNSKFNVVFKDGEIRTVEAFNFSCAVVIAAYTRYTEEGCKQHSQLNVSEYKSRVAA